MPARRDLSRPPRAPMRGRTLEPTGAIITTRAGATYHVQEHPRAVRAELRAAASIDAPAAVHTRAGTLVWLELEQVASVRAPGTLTPRARKWAARAAFWGGLVVMFIGGAGLTLGGAAVIGMLTGNGTGDEIGWFTIFPGVILFFLGGQLGSRGFEALQE